jgi:seryl-tRNA(Sec) selenium transferase
MVPENQGSQASAGELIARQRIAELERALAVSERCLISMTKALKKYGLDHSAASASELLQVIHKILHDRTRRKLH